MSTRGKPDPSLADVLRAIDGLSTTIINTRVGVSPSTINNWRRGKTRHPQNITMEFALRAAGYKRIIVKADD